jgi:hypothetical protein
MLDGSDRNTRDNERAPGNLKIVVPIAQVPRDIWGEFLMCRAALHYAEHLGPVFPVPQGTRKSHKKAKYSGGEPWGATRDPAQIRADRKKWPHANIGLRTGLVSGFFVVDVDTVEGHGVDGIANLQKLQEKHTPFPATLTAISPSGSLHYYFHAPPKAPIKNSESEIAEGVDVRGEGGMALVPPSVKPGGGEYRWLNHLPIAPAPIWLFTLARKDRQPERNPFEEIDFDKPYTDEELTALLEESQIKKSQIKGGKWHNAMLIVIGSLIGKGWSDDAIRTRCGPYCDKGRDDPDLLFFISDTRKRFGIPDPGRAAAPLFSEEALALEFAHRYGGELRHVAAWGKWLIYDGRRWEFDETLKTFTLARTICRDNSKRCNSPTQAKSIASARTRANVVSLAREDRRIAATMEQWDRDPWLLNTPGGTIDLRSGQMLPHRIDAYMTKLTAVTPQGTCPGWTEFLKTVTNGDAELQSYIQRALGYSLTGDIKEHALFFLYGTGANGKSVLLNTVARIFHDYHKAAPLETFEVSNTDRHPTELRRSDLRAFHAAGFFRIRAAVQAVDFR